MAHLLACRRHDAFLLSFASCRRRHNTTGIPVQGTFRRIQGHFRVPLWRITASAHGNQPCGVPLGGTHTEWSLLLTAKSTTSPHMDRGAALEGDDASSSSTSQAQSNQQYARLRFGDGVVFGAMANIWRLSWAPCEDSSRGSFDDASRATRQTDGTKDTQRQKKYTRKKNVKKNKKHKNKNSDEEAEAEANFVDVDLNTCTRYDATNRVLLETDTCGVTKRSVGDEMERTVLATWLRTAQWRESLTAVSDEDAVARGARGVPPNVGSGALAKAEASPCMATFVGEHVVLRLLRVSKHYGVFSMRMHSPNDDNEEHPFTKRRALAVLWLDVSSGALRYARVVAAGGIDSWRFADDGDDSPFAPPAKAILTPASQERIVYETRQSHDSSDDNPPDVLETSAGMLAPWAPRVSFHGGARVAVKCCRGNGGHIFVRAKIDGKDPGGWWLVDPSLTGMAITRSTASQMNLPCVAGGERRFVGLGGTPIKGRYRIAHNFSLGEDGAYVSFDRLTLVELELDGAVRPPDSSGDDKAVVGVVGADVINRVVAILDMPRRVPGSRSPAIPKVTVLDPTDADATNTWLDARTQVAWQEVRSFGGVPHVRLGVAMEDPTPLPGTPEAEAEEFATASAEIISGVAQPITSSIADPPGFAPSLGDFGGYGSTSDGGWFAIDLGIGGTAVVLTRAAAMRSRFVDARHFPMLTPGGVVTAPGETSARMESIAEAEVLSGRLARLEFRGGCLASPRAIVHVRGDPKNLQLSAHSCGAVSADALRGMTAVLDLANSRAAFVVHAAAS